jgi:hypothetical protein
MDSVSEFLSPFNLRIDWLPDWATSLIVMAAAVLLAWWLHDVVFAALERWVSGQDLFRRSLVSRMQGPSRLAAVMLATALAATIAPLTDGEAAAVRQVTIVGIVVVTGWFLLTALHVWLVVYLRRYKLDSEDNLLARKHVTQSRILERIARTLIVILTFAAALMTFDSVRQYGVGLFASAGAASLVLGLALQPMLKNLIAGVQLAITQPIRIDDALLVNNEWGQRRGDYLELRGHSSVGLAAHDRAAQLLHRAALPELDAGKLGVDRDCVSLCRLHGPGRRAQGEARGDRSSIKTLGWAGRRAPGYRLQGERRSGC